MLLVEFLPSDTEAVFVLARHMAVEYFDDGALLLNLRSRALIELEPPGGWILARLDGQHTIRQIAESYAARFAFADHEAIETVLSVCEKLVAAQSVRLAQGTWKGGTMDDARYRQNPDVNLREEDEDGALLFNPDTDKVQLLNTTGLYIWKLCAQGRTTGEIITALKADFDEAPEAAVSADVEEFVNQMVDSGFLGTLQPS